MVPCAKCIEEAIFWIFKKFAKLLTNMHKKWLAQSSNFFILLCHQLLYDLLQITSVLQASVYSPSGKKFVLNFLLSCTVAVFGAMCFKARRDRARTQWISRLHSAFSSLCSRLDLHARSTDPGQHGPLLGKHGVYVPLSPPTRSCGRRRNRAVKTTGLLSLKF